MPALKAHALLGASAVALLNAHAVWAQPESQIQNSLEPPTIASQNPQPPAQGAGAMVAQAQVAAAPSAMSQTAPEQVLITGSLLGAANFVAPTPVTQITGLQVETRALTGIGTVVEELPYAQTGQGLTRNTNGIVAAAQSLPNLRGLGANNTLVLINGQRPTPTNATNNFDTDMIPSALVDRFEVVTTGASATYGSDAVAGVVNFILKDRLQGFTSNVQYGVSQRGDENQILVSGGYGDDFAGGRGHFIAGFEYAKQYNTVNMYARHWGREEPGLVALSATRPAGLPAMILTNHAEVDNGTQGGLIASGPLKGIAFDLNGNPYNFPYGPAATVGASYMIGTGNFGQSALNRQLSPPYQRWAALARADYDITADVHAYGMIDYGQLESNDPSQGTPFPINFTILRDNPYLPTSVAAAMDAKHLSSIVVSKENFDANFTGNIADNMSTLVQGFAGITGSIFGNWDWDIEANAGKAVWKQAFLNTPVNANWFAASYVVRDANGTPVCGPAATNPMLPNNPAQRAALLAQQSPGCVPYNPFGTPTADSVRYIMTYKDGGENGSRNEADQWMFSAVVNGPAYMLPAGPLDLAVGANIRHNSYDQLGSPGAIVAAYNTRNPPSYNIDQTTWETYGEVGVPIVRDLPFATAIDVNAAARYTHYSISGGVTTWKFGGTWDVTDWLRLRATHSQDIRAPNFTEVVDLPTSSATNLQNPISGVASRISGILTTGNPNLQPEFSKNFTAGIVFTPTFDWLTGFRASVDYYRIKISGIIKAPIAQDVIDRCLLQKVQSFCNQITFSGTDINTTFGITNLHLLLSNLDAELQDGIDINLSEQVPLDQLGLPGSLNLSALGSYINQQREIETFADGTVNSTNFADTWSAPRWAWNVNATYSLDRVVANLQMRFYSPIKYLATVIGPDEPSYDPSNPRSINRNIWPAAITWNLHLSYDLIQEPDGGDLQVYFNVDNLFDKDPPIIWWYVSNYDVIGRYFRIGLRYTT